MASQGHEFIEYTPGLLGRMLDSNPPSDPDNPFSRVFFGFVFDERGQVPDCFEVDVLETLKRHPFDLSGKRMTDDALRERATESVRMRDEWVKYVLAGAPPQGPGLGRRLGRLGHRAITVILSRGKHPPR